MMQETGKLGVRRGLFFGVLCSAKGATIQIALLTFATVCFAGELQENAPRGADGPVSPDRQGIAPNQSASLEDSMPSTLAASSTDRGTERKSDAVAAPDEPVSKNGQAGSAGMNEVRAADPSDEVAAQGATRVGRRARRDMQSTMRSAPTLPVVPWYRTGIGALSIVLALIAAAVWGIRRWMPKLGGANCAVLNVVGRAGLTPKHSVALVSLGQRYVLVGLSGDRMTRICEVTDPQEVTELTLRLGLSRSPGIPVSTGGAAKGFESLLSGEVNEYANDSKPANMDVRRAKDRPGDNAPQSRPHRTREPLSALLERLRSLQLKK